MSILNNFELLEELFEEYVITVQRSKIEFSQEDVQFMLSRMGREIKLILSGTSKDWKEFRDSYDPPLPIK